MFRKTIQDLTTFKAAVKFVCIDQLVLVYINFRRIYLQNRLQALGILAGFIVILAASFVLIFYANSVRTVNPETDNISAVTIIPVISTLPRGATNSYLDNLKTGIESTAVLFDNFLSATADPTGRSACVKLGNGLQCSLYAVPSQEVYFVDGSETLPTTSVLAQKLIIVAEWVGTVLILLQGFNFLTNDSREDLKSFIFRVGFCVILLILTPYLISLSIIAINELNAYILGTSSLTNFLKNFLDSLNITTASNPFQDLWQTVSGWFSGGVTNLLDYITAIPVLVTLSLVELLLLYICFQFILRFMYLYFLTAVYPLTAIFAMHPKTSGIAVNFWKQWTTFLIQQPIFILGLMMIQDITKNIFVQGISFQNIVMFIGMLLFLCTVNVLSAKLWGDVYTAVTQNIAAAIGAQLVKTAMVDKPLEYASRFANLKSQSSLAAIEKKYLNTDYGKTTGTSTNGSSSPKPTDTVATAAKKSTAAKKTVAPVDDRSPLYKELAGSGYQVKPLDNGKLDVSGSFVAATDSKSGSVVMYTNTADALRDGRTPAELQTVSVNDLSIQDTSNKKMLSQYNQDVREVAADSTGHAKDLGLSFRSPDSKVIKNLDLAREANLQKGVQGIAVKNDGPQGDHSIATDNILKLHVYSEVLRNKTLT